MRIFYFVFCFQLLLARLAKAYVSFIAAVRKGRQGPHYLVPHPSVLMKSRCTHNFDLDYSSLFFLPFFIIDMPWASLFKR